MAVREAKRGSGREGEKERERKRGGEKGERGVTGGVTERHRWTTRIGEGQMEREYCEWESKNAAGPNARASRRMSFRVHDGVDALEAYRACGGSFSSRSYVDRKTFHVTSSLDAERAIIDEGSQGGSQPLDRSVSILFFFPRFRELSPCQLVIHRILSADNRKKFKKIEETESIEEYIVQCLSVSMNRLPSTDLVGVWKCRYDGRSVTDEWARARVYECVIETRAYPSIMQSAARYRDARSTLSATLLCVLLVAVTGKKLSRV